MTGLGLVPNEVVGYRVVPDHTSWNVALVKKHGKESKKAGQEYAQTLGYYKDLKSALLSIHDRCQKDFLIFHAGEVGKIDPNMWVASLEEARKGVDSACAALLEKFGGYSDKDLLKALNRLEPTDDQEQEN